MQKCVIVKCPMALTLFLNLEMIEPDIKVKLVKQTVAMKNTLVCDSIELKSTYDDLKIDYKELTDIEKEKIQETINLFEDVTSLKINNLNIKINRLNLRLSNLNFESIIAGLLIGLNEYYHTNLDITKLKKIGYQISPLVPYFLVGGFKKISEANREISSLPKNPYQNYLLIDKNKDLILPNLLDIKKYGIVNHNAKEKLLYTDFSKLVDDDYQDIRDYLKDYQEIESSLMGNTSLYLITSKDNLLLSRMKFRLNKEFPNYKIYSVSNTEGHKVLIKCS